MIDFLRHSTSHIFVDELSDTIEIAEETFHHLVNVLRVKETDSVSAASNGFVRSYEVGDITKARLFLNAVSSIEKAEEKEIHLCVSLFKLDRMEWGIAKAVETGATSITIGSTMRSTFSIDKKKRGKVQARLNALASSACSQSRRSRLVEVVIVDSLIDHIRNQNASVIICEPGKSKEVAVSFPVVLAVGPEGGFAQSELKELDEKAQFFEFSPNILRAETAMALAPAVINRL